MINEKDERAAFSFLPREIIERVEISNYLTKESLRKGFKRIEKIAPFVNYTKIRQILDIKTKSVSYSVRNKSTRRMGKKSLEKLSYCKYLTPQKKQIVLPKIDEKVDRGLYENTQERFFINSSLEDYDNMRLALKPNETINRKIIYSSINSSNKKVN